MGERGARTPPPPPPPRLEFGSLRKTYAYLEAVHKVVLNCPWNTLVPGVYLSLTIRPCIGYDMKINVKKTKNDEDFKKRRIGSKYCYRRK